MTGDETAMAVEIPGSLAGERLDRAVALLTGRPRAEVAALIDAGAVLLDGVVAVSRHARVTEGALLGLPVHVGVPSAPAVLEPAAAGSVPFDVVYLDDDVLVVDKPAGVVVHPGAGQREGTLIAGLLGVYPDLAAALPRDGRGDPLRPGIVHRLDKETSGLLVVARTPAAYDSLVTQLAARAVSRRYRALARGSLSANEGTIDAPIGRSPRDPTKMAVRGGGKEARTHYLVAQRFSEPIEASLLTVTLETGRTHQIRVHLAAIGHPIVGDRRYGGAARDLPVARPFLHAERLAFDHPRTGARVEATSELPEDLVEVLARLS